MTTSTLATEDGKPSDPIASSPDTLTPFRRISFTILLIFAVLLLLEALLSMGQLMQMRIAGKENFTLSEPTYFSIINVPYRAAAKLGLLNESVLLDSPYEFTRSYEDKGLVFPEPRETDDLPARRTEVTLSRRRIGTTQWERLRVNLTKNLDGSRWTGACPHQNGIPKVYVFGDSWIAGDGINDEHTFSYLLQQKYKNLCVKLYALGGRGLPTTLLQFRDMKEEITPNDYIIIGYADYLDRRSVVAPSRLREVRDWFKRMMNRDQTDRVSLPKVTIDNKGALEISYVEENCMYNNGYCEQADPSPAEMNKVSAAIVNQIADETKAKVYLLHFNGDRSNALRQNLRNTVTLVSALPDDFDYNIIDDVMGFDNQHPGPWWNYAIAQKLMNYLPKPP